MTLKVELEENWVNYLMVLFCGFESKQNFTNIKKNVLY